MQSAVAMSMTSGSSTGPEDGLGQVRPVRAEQIPCGPDPEHHVAQIRAFLDAGYDEVYVSQIGPDQEGFLRFYEREVLPQLG